jgi:hypothetical protein
MKKFKDKHTSIINQKYDKRMDWLENNSCTHRYLYFPCNKDFKNISLLIERKYNDKIWWKLLPKDSKKSIIYEAFSSGYDPYNLSKEKIDMINIFKEKNPLTKEIRDFKINLICS